MSYLITKDYSRIIQTTELNAITSSDISIRQLVEGATQIELQEYLIQRFDCSKEFSDTSQWSFSVAYKGNNRVYLNATAYSATSTYTLNDLTLQAGNVYICTSAIITPEAFNVAHWALLGAQYDLFYVTLPKPLFDQDTMYYKNDEVFWNDKIYKAQRDSIPLTRDAALQMESIETTQSGNKIPGAIDSAEMWGTGTSYALTAGTLPTDITKWTKGDNRNQHLVEIFMDCVVYKLCKRIAPNNVPEARHNAWVSAIETLKNYSNGKLNSQLPLIQPKTGQRIRYGGNPRETYSW